MTAPQRGDGEARHRLFVASWPSEAWRERHSQRLGQLEWAAGGRRVPASNYHLTLAFLGSASSSQLEAVRRCLDRVTVAGFSLSLDRLEYWGKPKVLCLVASRLPAAASDLVRWLWYGLSRLGFRQDPRPFAAHLTLARDLDRPAKSSAIDPIEWPVDRVALVESRTEADGPIYTPLAFWPLGLSSS